jgi:hypothetical protein
MEEEARVGTIIGRHRLVEGIGVNIQRLILLPLFMNG